jgi:23S rRNA (adenine2503-C2)-methyltransferase
VRASAWDKLPVDLEGQAGANGAYLFGRVQRPWTWDGDSPSVGRAARALFRGHDAPLELSLPRVVESRVSADGATKLVLELSDGARVEAVHMPRDVRTPRVTVCISSQVGCAMGCGFCATAEMGLVRNLTASEIVAQVMTVIRTLGPARGQALTLVFMGMGEPLHNVRAVSRAIAVMCHPAGLGVAPSRITVSTAGLVPGIDALARTEPRPLLAVSINATTDEARARTMPVTRAYGLADLRAALARWPLRPHEKVTLEYVLMADENDTCDDADRMAAFSAGLRHNVNVIPFNEYPGARFREPSEATLQRFVSRLQMRGCLVTVRRSRGRDVRAACGLLATESIARPSR